MEHVKNKKDGLHRREKKKHSIETVTEKSLDVEFISPISYFKYVQSSKGRCVRN